MMHPSLVWMVDQRKSGLVVPGSVGAEGRLGESTRGTAR